MNAAQKISKARAGLILDAPFFGSLALRLTVKADPTCETAWTDGTSLGYSPAWIDQLPLDHVKGVLCHEVLHCALEHIGRRGDRDAFRWNMAADYAINPIIEEAGFALPSTNLNDPAYAGMGADEIYSRLPDPGPSQDSPEQGQGQGKGKGQAAGTGPDKGKQTGNDPGGCGEVRDAKDAQGQPSAAAQSQAAADWRVATAQAAQQAKAMGQFPGGLARLVEEIINPKVDWRDALRRFVDQCARNDYRWFPPNRRHIHAGLYLPGIRSEEMPPIVVGVDTSGSIDQAQIDQFAAELTVILQDCNATACTVIYCDAAVQAVEEFGPQDYPVTLHPAGGGGTAFGPVFSEVEARGLTPACLIYLTDLQGTFPDHEPPYPVLWARTGECETVPPFGEVVEL